MSVGLVLEVGEPVRTNLELALGPNQHGSIHKAIYENRGPLADYNRN